MTKKFIISCLIVCLCLISVGLIFYKNYTPELSIYKPIIIENPIVGVAGVPKYLGETRNYDKIFKELRDNGFSTYMAFSQYSEHPKAKSLASDADFFPPCSPNDSQWKAMRDNNIKLIIPGYIIFADYFESLTPGDPLQELIDCIGRDLIFGVTNYDEPVGSLWDGSLTKHDLYTVYRKTKEVDPTIPVLMVHAPFYASNPVEGLDYLYPTSEERDKYFRLVKEASEYADIVGFDIYPIPLGFGGGLTSPSLDGKHITNFKSAIIDYLAWIKSEVPGKIYLVTLQGFNFAMQYEGDFVPDGVSMADIKTLRNPTFKELEGMAKGAIEGGALVLLWWGQTHITPQDASLWEDIKIVSKNIAN